MSDTASILGLGEAVSPGDLSAQGAKATPLSGAQKIGMLDGNADFQKLTYDKQQAVRTYALGKLPEFQGMSDTAKTYLLNAVAKMPPAYSDPAFVAEQKALEANLTQSFAYRENMQFAQGSLTGRASNWLTLALDKAPWMQANKLSDVDVKKLQGDPDAKKLMDYLSQKQGVSIPMPEGVRNFLGKVPVLGALASPDLAQALGDVIGVTADIAGTSMFGGPLARPAAAVGQAVTGALAKAGAGTVASAVLPGAARVLASAATSGAFGVARQAALDPASVDSVGKVAQTFGGWAAADAMFGGLHEGLAVRKALSRAGAMAESVRGTYPKLLEENAGPAATANLTEKTLKTTDPDFAAQPAGVQDMVRVREQIAQGNAADPQAMARNPVVRLQAQASVGPLARRGLDTSVLPNGDGTFRVRELPDNGGEIATVQAAQRGAQPKPLAAVTMLEASKEVARRYDDAVAGADARLAKEKANLDLRKGVAEKLSPPRAMLPLGEPPRSTEVSPAAAANWRALQEAKKSYASALIDRKALDDYSGSDIGNIRDTMSATKKALSSGPDDVVPMAGRSAISEGERQGLESAQGLKTINFAQSVDEGQLKTIGARKVFLDTDNPVAVKPSANAESNAVGVYAKPLDDAQFAQLTKAATLLKQKQGLAVDPLDLAHTMAAQVGADAVEHADGSVTLLYPKEQIKHVTDFVDPRTGRYYTPPFTRKGAAPEGSAADVRATNSLAGEVRIAQTVKENFPNISQPRVMQEFLAQKTLGELKATDMELLTKTAMAELDLPTSRVRVARVEREPGDMSVSFRYNGDTTTIAVPKNVNGVLEQQAFIKNYVNALNEATKEHFAAGAAEKRLAAKETALGPLPQGAKDIFLEAMKRDVKSEMVVKAAGENPARAAVASNLYKAPTPGADPLVQFAWFQHALGKVPGAQLVRVSGANLGDSVFELRTPGREPFQGNLASVTDEFLLRNTTMGALRHDLSLKGYDLKQAGGQVWVTDRNGKVLGGERFTDHVELMKTLGLRPDKIDGRFGPDSIEVGDPGVKFSYQGGAVSASLQEALRFAAKFSDMSGHEIQRVVLRQKEGSVSYSKISAQYVVDMKDLGIHRTFKSGSAAFKFLRGEVNDIHNLILDAENKGFALYREDGKYVVSDPVGRHVVDTREEVRKVIATVPDAEWAPNLLGPYDKPLLDSTEAPGNSVFTTPHVNWLSKGIALARQTVSNLFRPAQPRIEALAAAAKLPQVSKDLADLRGNLKLAEHQTGLFANATLQHLSGMSPLERSRFMEYMEAGRQDVKTRILKDLYGQDTSTPAAKGFVAKAEAMRGILGETPTQGAFARLGLASDKFETSWMPRLQKMLANDVATVEKYNAMPDGAAALMRDLNVGNVPKNLAFISQHMRVSDFVDLARETDSARALANYYKQGFFWLHAGPSMEKFYNSTHGPGVPEQLSARADHFIKTAMGSVKNDYTAVSKALAREAGLISPEAGDMTNFLLNMGTSNIFIFKPWSAVRQVMDTYASAAPLLGGNRLIDAGFASVRKDLKGALQEGIDKRLLSERLPTTEPTISASRFFSKYFTKAHELVQQGDVIPRMAVYRAAGMQFEEGMKKLAENPAVRPEDALVAWPWLHDGVQAQIKQFVAAKDYVSAKHAYGADLSEMTQGTFRSEDQGMMRNSFGFIGRAWGQLMSMPMLMNDLRFRLLTKGSVAQRALALGTMTKNVAAIATGLNMAGIDGSSFLPLNDLTISGGPVFNMLLDIVTSTSGNQTAQTQAIKDLERTAVARMLPFGSLVNRAIKTVQYAEQGQLWKALLAATATPIAKTSLVKGAKGQGIFGP